MPASIVTEPKPGSPPYSTLEAITGDENLFILAPQPGDESLLAGGLIAQCCRRGRPPFVMVVHDGSTSAPGDPGGIARRHERETRAAVGHLGLPGERLLMAGLYDGADLSPGTVFDAVVRAVALVMWARDCNVVCAPAVPSIGRIAEAVADRTGVGRLVYGSGPLLLDIDPDLPAKRAAVAAHTAIHTVAPGDVECFARGLRPGRGPA